MDDATVRRLPGIGACLNLTDVDGAAVSVVARVDGQVEVHTATGASRLSPGGAAALGAFLTGGVVVDPRLSARVDDVLGGLVLSVVPLRGGAGAAGRSIADLAIRRRTGVTVVAVLRGPIAIVAPEATQVLQAGDDLAVIGRAADVAGLGRILAGRG